MLNVLKKIDKSIEWVQLVMCCIIMFAIMWLTFAMVFWRYALNNSIVWAEEILRYIMIWGVLVGAGLTTREDQHVSMDILQGAFARWPKLRAAHYLITRIIVFGFMILDICKKYDAEYLGTEYGEKWFENRITFFYPGYIMNNPQMFGTLDTVATYDNIEKIYWAMKKAVEETYDGVRFISHSSHWYDWGCMNYSRFIIDNPPEDQEECIRLHNRIWNAGVRAAIANGGVINDHHGVGLKLGRLMKESYGPAMQVLQGIKKELDPNGIMNPYKMGL